MGVNVIYLFSNNAQIQSWTCAVSSFVPVRHFPGKSRTVPSGLQAAVGGGSFRIIWGFAKAVEQFEPLWRTVTNSLVFFTAGNSRC